MDSTEQIAKIVSLIAIPVIVALFGLLIQDTVARRNVSQEYVNLAVTILRDRDKSNPELRDWAVDLLNQNSPTRFSPGVIQQLRTGETSFPQILSTYANPTLALSPSGQQVAVANEDGKVVVSDLRTGQIVTTLGGFTDVATALAFSPDGGSLFVAKHSDVTRWDIPMGLRMSSYKVPGDVAGLSVTLDGKTLLVRSTDGRLAVWNIGLNALERVILLPR